MFTETLEVNFLEKSQNYEQSIELKSTCSWGIVFNNRSKSIDSFKVEYCTLCEKYKLDTLEGIYTITISEITLFEFFRTGEL